MATMSDMNLGIHQRWDDGGSGPDPCGRQAAGTALRGAPCRTRGASGEAECRKAELARARTVPPRPLLRLERPRGMYRETFLVKGPERGP